MLARFGYSNPVNYNDNELYCGGFSVQWANNDGKCGVCGDNWADPAPRPHEVRYIEKHYNILRYFEIH